MNGQKQRNQNGRLMQQQTMLASENDFRNNAYTSQALQTAPLPQVMSSER